MKNEGKKSSLIILEIFTMLFCIIIIYPLIMMINISFKSDEEVIRSPLFLVQNFKFDNYITAFKQMGYFIALKNSIILTVCSVLLGVLLYSMAAYAFMRAKKCRKLFSSLYFFIIIGHILPGYSALTPLVFLLKNLHMINTLQGIISVYIGASAAYSIFLLSRFVNTVPPSLEESAFMDGCTPIGIFFKIMLPLLKPPVITLIIIKAVDIWNDMISPLVVLQGKNNRTLPLAVYFLRGEYNTQWNLLFAALVLSIIPITVFYFVMQRQIIGGLMSGSVKS